MDFVYAGLSLVGILLIIEGIKFYFDDDDDDDGHWLGAH